MSPKVSIILSCYGVERYLDRCVNSLIHQTLDDIEIILVDDASPDRVPEMCDEWAKRDNRIMVVHKDKNDGLGYARNSGFDVATGKYVAFIDSDDYVSDSMMENLYTAAEKYQAQAAYCGFCIVDGSGKVVATRIEVDSETRIQGSYQCKQVGLEMIGSPTKRENCKYSMSVWHAIYQRQFLIDKDIRFCSEREFISEDMIFDVDFFGQADNVVFIPEAHYYYCYNESSLSRKFSIIRYKKNIIHYRELLRRMPLRGFNEIEINSAHKYLIWVMRNFLYTLYRQPIPISEKREVLKDILDNEVWESVSHSSVINILPTKPALFYYCFINKKKYLLECLIKIANLKYK